MLQSYLEKHWYLDAPVSWWQLALESVYLGILKCRRWCYRTGIFQIYSSDLPIIVVGNISVGGTGKTPLVIALTQELTARGWRVGVVSRGYGGSAKGPLLVEAQTQAKECGDEPLLIHRISAVPLAIARKRTEAVRMLEQRGDVDVIISDDGLQHWSMARDIQIIVVDGKRGFGNGRLLPAGPLREPASAAKAADYVVVNGAACESISENQWSMNITGDSAYQFSQPAQRVALSHFAQKPVHAVAGIGNPQRFFDMLTRFNIQVIAHALPDHHDYLGDEWSFSDDSPVLVTEKDAIKWRFAAPINVYIVPVQAELDSRFFDQVHARLHQIKQGKAQNGSR